jgi:hypothetical protein
MKFIKDNDISCSIDEINIYIGALCGCLRAFKIMSFDEAISIIQGEIESIKKQAQDYGLEVINK